MAQAKCNACLGVYSTTTADGSQYFHACPPIPNPVYQPDPLKAALNLRDTVERANKRDENVTPTSVDKKVSIISTGASITAL